MIIGIDGNCWYCSNGLCLGDPRAQFTFARTLQAAIDDFHAQFNSAAEAPEALWKYLQATPEEYRGGLNNEI